MRKFIWMVLLVLLLGGCGRALLLANMPCRDLGRVLEQTRRSHTTVSLEEWATEAFGGRLVEVSAIIEDKPEQVCWRRGPVKYWVRLDEHGHVANCTIEPLWKTSGSLFRCLGPPDYYSIYHVIDNSSNQLSVNFYYSEIGLVAGGSRWYRDRADDPSVSPTFLLDGIVIWPPDKAKDWKDKYAPWPGSWDDIRVPTARAP